MTKVALPKPTHRRGMTLLEVTLVLSLTGMLMLFTIRVFHLAMQVHETGVRTATHLRLASSLEDRVRSDVSRAHDASTPATNELRLLMPGQREVIYQLTSSNVVERRTVQNGQASAADQRWTFSIDLQMNVNVKPLEDRAESLKIVRFNLSRPTSELRANQALQQLLRGVEVCEVTHAK